YTVSVGIATSSPFRRSSAAAWMSFLITAFIFAKILRSERSTGEAGHKSPIIRQARHLALCIVHATRTHPIAETAARNDGDGERSQHFSGDQIAVIRIATLQRFVDRKCELFHRSRLA